MHRLNRDLIRRWLEEHNWTVGRLAEECSALSEDTISPRAMRNAVNGTAPIRPGRVRLICRVTEKYGDGIRRADLVAEEAREAPRVRS